MAIRAYEGRRQVQVEREAFVDLQGLQEALHLQEDDGSYLFVAKKLMYIVLSNQNERDPLSNKLFSQGSDLALFMLNARAEEFPLERLLSSFFGLKTVIQQECRCEKVTEIWLTGTVAWEKRELDLYCKALSLRSGRVITCLDLGMPHVFGNEVLQWIQDMERPFAMLQDPPPMELALPAVRIEMNELGVPVVEGLEEREEDLIVELANADPEELIDIRTADEVLMIFKERMEGVISERKKIQLTEMLEKQNALLKKTLQQKDEQYDRDLVRKAESDQGQINFLENSLNRTKANFDSAIEERKQIEKQLMEGLEACKNELGVAKVDIIDLKGQVANLLASNSWLRQKVQGQEDRIRNMNRGGDCVIS